MTVIRVSTVEGVKVMVEVLSLVLFDAVTEPYGSM